LHVAVWLRGGGDNRGSQFSESPALFSTQKASDSTDVARATQAANCLCDSDASRKAMQIFGGLQYYNTNIDKRFRSIFVLGGPGAGKGTQCALMEEHYPVAHFSVGELLRNVQNDNPNKELIEQTLASGQIVPVEISLDLLRRAMEEQKSKHVVMLVDGFPRNFDNLNGWCQVMEDVAVLESVMVYQCPFEVLQDRILERSKISGRSDDNLEALKRRFETFDRETVPVIDTLRTAAKKSDQPRWTVVDIKGDRSLDEVWLSTQETLNQVILHDILTANAALLRAVHENDIETYTELVDPRIMGNLEPHEFVKNFESKIGGINIKNARVDIVSGKKAAVSYDRVLQGSHEMREKRFWSHQGALGWRNVWFERNNSIELDMPQRQTQT
jgi:UMP-CMP kinase